MAKGQGMGAQTETRNDDQDATISTSGLLQNTTNVYDHARQGLELEGDILGRLTHRMGTTDGQGLGRR